MANLFSLDDLDLDQLETAGKLALEWRDNPKFPRRTDEKKIEDGVYGNAGEQIIQRLCPTLRRYEAVFPEDKKGKYQDFYGKAVLFGKNLDGIVEVKVLKKADDYTARQAMDRHLSHSKADWFVFLVADRVQQTLRVWRIRDHTSDLNFDLPTG